MTSCGLLHLAEREHKLLVTALDSDALNAHKVPESGLSRPSAVACAKRGHFGPALRCRPVRDRAVMGIVSRL